MRVGRTDRSQQPHQGDADEKRRRELQPLVAAAVEIGDQVGDGEVQERAGRERECGSAEALVIESIGEQEEDRRAGGKREQRERAEQERLVALRSWSRIAARENDDGTLWKRIARKTLVPTPISIAVPSAKPSARVCSESPTKAAIPRLRCA